MRHKHLNTSWQISMADLWVVEQP